ncbi:dCTP deaminase [Amycolatopsis acidicola]|uniref:dCTP deaminase n=1 Tax=Amycolatopsis acidicola TaxID=2596893 RepID=A0A5N0UKZ4_9PSEU|nr:dCTP deaminase [Amycolatopsis acidicola]KAA9150342.1 dCTP deaminase [Amycolatopsis acidicola]
MILTGTEIRRQVALGRIEIEPFEPAQVNPNSYDFRLGPTLLVYRNHELDARAPEPADEVAIPAGGFVLSPDRVYLGSTAERMGSDHYVPVIRGKSSLGRLGLFVNITADLIDIGSHNHWTLQFHAVQPLRIYPGMRIGQVTFWVPEGEIRLYEGKYQGATGPRASESFRDFG